MAARVSMGALQDTVRMRLRQLRSRMREVKGAADGVKLQCLQTLTGVKFFFTAVPGTPELASLLRRRTDLREEVQLPLPVSLNGSSANQQLFGEEVVEAAGG